MTTVHNDIYIVLKCILHQQSILHVEIARHLNINDWVLVDKRNRQAKFGNNKFLKCKWLGPCQVKKSIGSYAYELEVPKSNK